MKRLPFFFMFLPLFAIGQQVGNTGIRFEHKLTWDQIQEKAKKSNRYIFVDCYATWCYPCKKMDMEAYQSDSVGKYMNDRFICVKVQLDTSKQDDEEVKKWYEVAHQLQKKYNISAFPTFLYFSPEGKILHRDLGYKKPLDFVTLSKNALDSNEQYYLLLAKYQRGDRNYEVMANLAKDTKRFNETTLANSIAKDYIDNYLIGLNDSALYKRENMEFVLSFIQIISSKDKIFNSFYSNGQTVDAIMDHKGLSQSVVDFIITKEMIAPALTNINNSHPKWTRIQNNIRKVWGSDYAERNVLSAKVKWYRSKENWKNYTKYLVLKVDRYGVGNYMVDALLNDNAYYVFMYSNNKEELTKVLSWIEQSLKLSSVQGANKMDTKSNILYKLGKREQAIELEEIACQMEPDNKEIRDNLAKMKKGEPTWPQGQE